MRLSKKRLHDKSVSRISQSTGETERKTDALAVAAGWEGCWLAYDIHWQIRVPKISRDCGHGAVRELDLLYTCSSAGANEYLKIAN
jgi:hypothetical protein